MADDDGPIHLDHECSPNGRVCGICVARLSLEVWTGILSFVRLPIYERLRVGADFMWEMLHTAADVEERTMEAERSQVIDDLVKSSLEIGKASLRVGKD